MRIDWTSLDGALFDLDGVLTPTATVHEAAWKRAFDEFLADVMDHAYEPFEQADYLAYVDGKPRYDGVRSFLASRSIVLPEGAPTDPPGHDTVSALGNLKNEMFNRVLSDEGVQPYPDAIELLDALGDLRMGVVSSSANAVPVLAAAAMLGRFSFVMDGLVARERHLPGKPAPDTFVVAAEEIGCDPARTVVFEDAVSGVAAGAAGGFAVVVGVDRVGSADALRDAGATIVVELLSELMP